MLFCCFKSLVLRGFNIFFFYISPIFFSWVDVGKGEDGSREAEISFFYIFRMCHFKNDYYLTKSETINKIIISLRVYSLLYKLVVLSEKFE